MTTAKKIDINGLQLDKPDNTENISFTYTDGLKIEYDLLTANPKTFKINKNGVNFIDNTNNNTTGLERLALVQTAFQAVELPPNATTLKLNETLLLDNGSFNTTYGIGLIDTTGIGMSIIAPNTNIYLGDVNGTANSTAISIDDTAKTINLTTDNGTIGGYCNIFQVGDVNGNVNSTSITLDDNNSTINLSSLAIELDCKAQGVVEMGDIVGVGNLTKISITDTTSAIDINAINGLIRIGDANNINNHTQMLVNDTHKEIDLFCVDLFVNKQGSQNMVLTPTYTNLYGGNISYGGGNSWQIASSNTMLVPNDLITETNGLYDWKMEFCLNCWNMNNQDDKALAFYIEIVDNSSNISQGYSFNQNIPYTIHKNSSTYSQTSKNSENYGWIDYYNFNNFTSTPLIINLYINADSGYNCEFQWNLHLTKTNVV